MVKCTKVRKSLQPGTVCIVLAGPYRGRRVVNLGPVGTQGLIAVTGPFKLNGVPLRRVDPAYVIATSTKVDISNVDCTEVENKLFGKAKKAMRKRSEKQFLKMKESTKVADEMKAMFDVRKKLQIKIDESILKNLSKTPSMAKYIASRFTLRRNEAPHKMKF